MTIRKSASLSCYMRGHELGRNIFLNLWNFKKNSYSWDTNTITRESWLNFASTRFSTDFNEF